jgi:hypothetical protein
MAHSLHRIGLAPVSAFAEHCYNYIYTVEGGSHLLFQVKQTGELKHRQMLHDSPMTRKTYKKKNLCQIVNTTKTSASDYPLNMFSKGVNTHRQILSEITHPR